jgi:hypothetical protein
VVIVAGVTFLPMAVGGVLAAVWLALYERRRGGGAGPEAPEAKLLVTFPVAPLVAAGLL